MGWFFRSRPPAPPPRWPLERRWGDGGRPLPRRWVLPDGAAPPPRLATHQPLDICARLRGLCADAARRCPDLAHVDVDRILVTFTPSRTRSRYGLQARVTPMRFRDGALARRVRGRPYQVQRYFVDGREVLYLVTFCLPRFLDQTFHEKMVTVFHELYHIGEKFDGDLRRHPGRYAVHSHSKRDYDRRMGELVAAYLAGGPDPEAFSFLRWGYADLWRYNGGITGVVVPRPKLLPA
jgi:predicted metallopeptidase